MSQHVFAFRHPTGALTIVGHSHNVPPQGNPLPGCLVEVYKDRLAFIFAYLSSGPWITFVEPGSHKVLDVYPTEGAALDALANVMTTDWEKITFPSIRDWSIAQKSVLGLVKDGNVICVVDLLRDKYAGEAWARGLGATDVRWFPDREALWEKMCAPKVGICYGIVKGSEGCLFGPYWSIDAPEVQAAFTLGLPVYYFPTHEEFEAARSHQEKLWVMHHLCLPPEV
jgi:hypothetical protein